MNQKIFILSFLLFQTTAIAKIYCNESNYKEFIRNSDKTARLLKQTGQGCQLENIKFKKTRNLAGVFLVQANLEEVDLRGMDLRGTHLGGANLTGVYLLGTDLRGGILFGAILVGADLKGADLRGAILGRADLRGADLRGTDLRGADLARADLRGANFAGADLSMSILDQALYNNNTNFLGVDKDFHPKRRGLIFTK